MKNNAGQWRFEKRRASRPPLNEKEVIYWKEQLARLLKVGIELEYNLPENDGDCARTNYLCKCVATFKPENPQPNTDTCYEQCGNWKDGNCEIAKKHGCAGIYCSAFAQPCFTCDKYDRGCEKCPQLYDPRKDPDNARKFITEALAPTGFVGEVGKSGVYQVVGDGSLLGGKNNKKGVEVVTTGRRPEFNSLHEMLRKIINECRKYGAYTDKRCSIHIHLLASYLNPGFSESDRGSQYLRSEITELEKPVPEIILANFHQLVRRYQTALIWMGTALSDPKHITRWEKFRKSLLGLSAMRRSMKDVANQAGKIGYRPKYTLVNYQPSVFDDKGDCRRLHVEIRHMDGNMSPAAIAATAVLTYGLMLKAVEISAHGLLQSGDKEYMELQREQMEVLCNGDGDWGASRLSDNRNLDPFIDGLIEQSKQLVRLVKNTLVEQTPADDILRSLAVKPCSLRLIEGANWKEIEKQLYPEGAEKNSQELGFARYVQTLLDTAAIAECDSGGEWMDAVAQELADSEEKGDDIKEVANCRAWVEEHITSELLSNKIFWSQKIGGYARR